MHEKKSHAAAKSIGSGDRYRSPVLESVAFVIDRLELLRFHPDAIAPGLERWGQHLEASQEWDTSLHFFDGTVETARWLFVVDVLNHCFWADPGQPTWTVSYRGKPCSGYWGLTAALKRAMEASIPITRADFLENLSRSGLEEIFAGTGEIPLFEERLENLHEAGYVLRTRWRGDIANLLEAARGRALEAVQHVVDTFPSFRDEAVYDGRRVCFWKRAQIFVSDLYHAFSGRGWGRFSDINRLTAFADYKLPQVLRAMGVISYRDELAEQVDGRLALEPGSQAEVEIRALTIWAVEAIREALAESGRTITSAQIDQWLWQLGQLEPFRKKPYHLCRTIYY